MDASLEAIDGGLWGLFLSCFLAATILPFSSEAILAAMAMGPWSTLALWVVASAGNWLGGSTCYAIGRTGNIDRIGSWLRMDQAKVLRYERSVQKHGSWLALLTWLPLIGDPLAVALGVGKAPLVPVMIFMFIGKALRYFVVLQILR